MTRSTRRYGCLGRPLCGRSRHPRVACGSRLYRTVTRAPFQRYMRTPEDNPDGYALRCGDNVCRVVCAPVSRCTCDVMGAYAAPCCCSPRTSTPTHYSWCMEQVIQGACRPVACSGAVDCFPLPHPPHTLLCPAHTGDDNVHFLNSMELVNSLVENQILFEMMAYPNQQHGLSSNGTQEHVWRVLTRYVMKNL